MLRNLLNIIISILMLPLLVCLFLYLTLRKLIQPKWSFFENPKMGLKSDCKVANIPFKNISAASALSLIQNNIESAEKQVYYFINPHAINIAQEDHSFQNILSQNEYNFPDGIGIKIAGLIEKYSLVENLNGTDFYPKLMDTSERNGFRVFFLGGSPKVIEAFEIDAKKRWPDLKVSGSFHGYFDKKNESIGVVENINQLDPDILLVSFGMPLQEKWINEYYSELNVKAIFATGGLFDFFSGEKKRAPEAWRQIGLEWLYRLFLEPGRMWKRYIIGNPLFLSHVIRTKYLKI